MADDGPWLVVGLGNPGPGYAATRHNAGTMTVDALAEQLGGRFKSHKSRNDIVETRIGEQRVVLAKPRCYMNESGGPVSSLRDFFGSDVERIVAIHDELDLDFDRIRVKLGGGDNGHNGLKSMRKSLGSGEFYRVRVGIGRPPGRQDPADFVLRPFGGTERKDLPLLITRAADAVESLVRHGLAATQNAFND